MISTIISRAGSNDIVITETFKYISAPLNYPINIYVYPHTTDSVMVTFRGVSTGVWEELLLGYKVMINRKVWSNDWDGKDARICD